MSTKTRPFPVNKVIIVRHAHRSKSLGADADNGLSPKGRKQAARIQKFFKSRFGAVKPWIISSPKLRCRETVGPIAKAARAKVEVSNLLDEGGDLIKKVRAFHRDLLRASQPLTVICVHGDWAPVYLQEMTGAWIDLDKGAWAELELEAGGRAKLIWLVQEL